MTLLNKLFRKSKPAVKPKDEKKVTEKIIETPKKAEPVKKLAEFKSGGVLLSPINTEKAASAQKLNKYVFKVVSSANKIEIAKAVGKNYNVKAARVNIINIPKKARQVGKTKGFKSGYKKTVITLAEGQSMEIK